MSILCRDAAENANPARLMTIAQPEKAASPKATDVLISQIPSNHVYHERTAWQRMCNNTVKKQQWNSNGKIQLLCVSLPAQTNDNQHAK
jgi:hypothetical protein